MQTGCQHVLENSIMFVFKIVRCLIMKKRRNYEDLGDSELDAETSAMVEKMIAQADQEVELARMNLSLAQIG